MCGMLVDKEYLVSLLHDPVPGKDSADDLYRIAVERIQLRPGFLYIRRTLPDVENGQSVLRLFGNGLYGKTSGSLIGNGNVGTGSSIDGICLVKVCRRRRRNGNGGGTLIRLMLDLPAIEYRFFNASFCVYREKGSERRMGNVRTEALSGRHPQPQNRRIWN